MAAAACLGVLVVGVGVELVDLPPLQVPADDDDSEETEDAGDMSR